MGKKVVDSRSPDRAPSSTMDDCQEDIMFSDIWWPKVAHQCHRRLAARPQLLPEDPEANGVLSFIEYELACKPQSATCQQELRTDIKNPSAFNKPSPDESIKPLSRDEEWRWLLRGAGEVVFPKGGRR